MRCAEASKVTSRQGRASALLIGLALLCNAVAANASGPRWVTGPPYFTGAAGNPVVWYTTHPLYFTDPGDLSTSVNHATADAIVAAAAAVWNVPTSAMVLAYGGSLNEHVSSANTSIGSTGTVFPADVQSSNYTARQIAVIYDSDGSITDLLLGSGASDPLECRQNGVTESVDSFSPAGQILHAVLVLNGRCTGAAPQKQLQMQYQLERAFGRVLGVGWSQTNDNVFTRSPLPTYAQALHWPIMHPIDIVCGAYTYLCLPQPFTLRDDDVAAITTLYPYMAWNGLPPDPPAPGKVWSYQQASFVSGTVNFPTGEGMQGVNIVAQRQQGNAANPETWYDVSSVSGFLYQQNAGNPITGSVPGIAGSMGSTDGGLQGYYNLGWIPDIDPAGAPNGAMTAALTMEPINPLYIGAYAVGPYGQASVTPSGKTQSLQTDLLQPYLYGWNAVVANFAPSDAASNCDTTGDGVESSPNPVAAEGWWTGVLCAHGHAAWSSFNLSAGRTAALEVTALDESGTATTAKALPLIGAWAATDPTGTSPTVVATPSAFNTASLGMTAASFSATSAAGVRFVLADARGDGRPDFSYRARVLYANKVEPAITSLSGGPITISGMGFSAGSQVLVNGVAAEVSSRTASSIVAIAPPVTAFPSQPATAVDIAVVDPVTGGTTTMQGTLTYSNIPPAVMALVSAPSGTVSVGSPASTPFAVRILLGDGVTPVAGLAVTFSVTSGNAQFGACAAASCVVLTDASGTASTSVTAAAFGPVTVQAGSVGALQSVTFRASQRTLSMLRNVEYVAAGVIVNWTPQVTAVQDGAAVDGLAVDWTGSPAISVSPGSSLTDANGTSQTSASAGLLAAGTRATGQACAWTTVCAGFAAVGVDASAWRVAVVSGAGQTVALAGTFKPVVLIVTDGNGNPVAGAAVSVYQTVSAWETPCPDRGRCPLAPILSSSDSLATSDSDGVVSVNPMQVEKVAEVTNIAVAAGTQGFASLSLVQGP